MELATLLRAMMLYLFNSKHENINNPSDASTQTEFNVPKPALDGLSMNDGNKENVTEAPPITALVSYDYDCAMPYPPELLEENPTTRQTNSKIIQTNDIERPHAKATFTIPINIVHRLPDAAVLDLHRFEDYCEEKILNCYHAIRDFNNYNYEKNQEIQYLSYTEKRKQEIIEQSQEKKSAIQTAYNKMHQVCIRTEKYREKITTVLNPYLPKYSKSFAQPKRVPKEWYDIHNLETIVQQLFTPKLPYRTHYDEQSDELRMSRLPILDPERKEFIPLPMQYLTNNHDDNDKETVDGSNLVMDYNHPESKKAITTKQFNDNVLQQYTYSTNDEIQQIIIYYIFKYFELKVRNGTRKVFNYTRLLKQKKSNFEDRLADAIKELQTYTIEMERNRVVPELIGLYNAENAAKDLLPHTKFITKLIGPTNKRVITAFNPSESILFNAIDGPKTELITDNNIKELTRPQKESEREDLKEPLYWDQNWTWDF